MSGEDIVRAAYRWAAAIRAQGETEDDEAADLSEVMAAEDALMAATRAPGRTGMSGPAKYLRVQPAEVEAIRYLPGPGESCNCAEVDEFTDGGADPCTGDDCSEWSWDIDGVLSAQPGEWIVKIAEDRFEVYSDGDFTSMFAPASAQPGGAA